MYTHVYKYIILNLLYIFQNRKRWMEIITRKNAIVDYLDYQIPVTQLMGPKENGDMQAAKRD